MDKNEGKGKKDMDSANETRGKRLFSRALPLLNILYLFKWQTVVFFYPV